MTAATTTPTPPGDRLARYGAALAAGHWPTVILTFVGLVAFYWLTRAGNLGETDDAYFFAMRAEDFPLHLINDSRLMLYHTTMQLLYRGSEALDLGIRALELMRGVSALCAGAFLILVVRVMVRHLGVSPLAALAGATALGVTYGFWRYAAEAEIYIPGLLMLIVVFDWLLAIAARDAEKWTAAIGPGLLAGVSVLYYQPNAIPLFMAMPLLFVRQGRWRTIVAYGAVGGLVFMSGYLIAFLVVQAHATEVLRRPLTPLNLAKFMTQRRGEFGLQPLSVMLVIKSLVRAPFALGHDIVSANWIFGFDWIRLGIQKIFSAHMIAQEAFTAKHGGWLVWPPLVLLPAIGVVGLLALKASRFWQTAWLWRPWRSTAHGVVIVWMLLVGAVIGRLNAAGIEAWIMALLPITLFVVPLVFEPCLRVGRGVLLAALVGLLFAHNAIGGMGMVYSPAAEHNRVKAAWVLDNATPADLVIVVGDPDLDEMLDYLSHARIALIAPYNIPKVADGLLHGNLRRHWVESYNKRLVQRRLSVMVDKTWALGGRLIVFEDFFRFGKRVSARRYVERMEELRGHFTVVHKHPEVSDTYVLERPIVDEETGRPLP